MKLILGGFTLVLAAALTAVPLLGHAQTSDASPPQLPAPPPPPLGSATSAPTQTASPTSAPAATQTPAPAPTPIPTWTRPLRDPVRAPRFSLWAGGGLGLLAYGGGLYLDNPMTQSQETVGNFVGPGLGLEVDVGARIERRYLPYLVGELGLVGSGHRFDGTSASAGTSFVGVGFRFLAGDVNNISLVSDLSFGIRRFQVNSGGQSWSATGLEIFRVGVGLDVRLTNQFTITPLLTLSGGTLTSTSGFVPYAPNQGDGVTGTPTFANGSIPSGLRSNYYAVVIGCGGHFDLFGHY